MTREDVMIEAYDLIKGEIELGYTDTGFMEGVVKMAEAVLGMFENDGNR